MSRSCEKEAVTLALPPFEIGARFGDWTVVAQIERDVPRGPLFSRVRCVCGRERELQNNYLRAGHSNGCGCGRAFGHANKKHGKCGTPTYGLWTSIKDRIKSQAAYRDVKMHEPWRHDFDAFEAFIESLGPKPTPEHTLDRIDPAGHYEPGNLRWASKREQALNRRDAGKYRTRWSDRRWHGKSATPAYRWWQNIKYRLVHQSSYAGVKMHESWVQDFEAFDRFIETLGPKPTPEHTLDRIDPCGHYEPGNLRWADKVTQSENRRNSVHRNIVRKSVVAVGEKHGMLTVLELLIEKRHDQNVFMARVRCECGKEKVVYQKQLLPSDGTKSCGCFKARNIAFAHKANERPINVDGETRSLSEWARRAGMSRRALWNRIHKLGWDPARAVREPLREAQLYDVKGESLTAEELSAKCGVPLFIIRRRIAKGWSPERAATQPERSDAGRWRGHRKERQPAGLVL